MNINATDNYVEIKLRIKHLVVLCVCVRPSTVKASSVWIVWDTMEQINGVL